jgi:WD40 repeat protein
VWDATTGKRRLTLPAHSCQVFHLAFSPDGKILATPNGDTLRLWDAATGRAIRRLRHRSEVDCFAFSLDGKILATGSGPDSKTLGTESRFKRADGTIRLWDLTAGKVRLAVKAHVFEVDSIAFSPDGTTLASAGDRSDLVILWDVASGKQRLRLRAGRFLSDCSAIAEELFWHPPGARLEFIADVLRRLAAGEGMTASIQDYPTQLAFSPDGKLLATTGADDGAVRLWDAATGKLRMSFQAHKGGVYSVAFSPDGKLLATGGATFSAADSGPDHGGDADYDDEVRLWDVATGKERLALAHYHTPFAFSPDSKAMTFGGKKPVPLRDLGVGTHVR